MLKTAVDLGRDLSDVEEEHMGTLTAPTIDGQALARLDEELQDRSLLCAFLHSYLHLLDRGVDRLERAMAARNLEEWTEAVHRLQTSSVMAAATALCQATTGLQERIAPHPGAVPCWPQPDEQAPLMAQLRSVARDTRAQLADYLQCIAPED